MPGGTYLIMAKQSTVALYYFIGSEDPCYLTNRLFKIMPMVFVTRRYTIFMTTKKLRDREKGTKRVAAVS